MSLLKKNIGTCSKKMGWNLTSNIFFDPIGKCLRLKPEIIIGFLLPPVKTEGYYWATPTELLVNNIQYICNTFNHNSVGVFRK